MAIRPEKAKRLATKRVRQYGCDTTINGSAALPAVWTEAGMERIQTFINPDEWNKEAFEIRFQARALDSPYLLKNGSDIIRTLDGWHGVVRTLTPHHVGNRFAAVTALVVLVPN